MSFGGGLFSPLRDPSYTDISGSVYTALLNVKFLLDFIFGFDHINRVKYGSV